MRSINEAVVSSSLAQPPPEVSPVTPPPPGNVDSDFSLLLFLVLDICTSLFVYLHGCAFLLTRAPSLSWPCISVLLAPSSGFALPDPAVDTFISFSLVHCLSLTSLFLPFLPCPFLVHFSRRSCLSVAVVVAPFPLVNCDRSTVAVQLWLSSNPRKRRPFTNLRV